MANFSNGKPIKSKSFELISFWVKNNKRAEIFYYSYKASVRRETLLTFVGLTPDGKGFEVAAPNGNILTFLPVGKSLKVNSKATKKITWFSWQYVGPIQGVGSWCDECVEDEDAASDFIRKYFLKREAVSFNKAEEDPRNLNSWVGKYPINTNDRNFGNLFSSLKIKAILAKLPLTNEKGIDFERHFQNTVQIELINNFLVIQGTISSSKSKDALKRVLVAIQLTDNNVEVVFAEGMKNWAYSTLDERLPDIIRNKIDTF